MKRNSQDQTRFGRLRASAAPYLAGLAVLAGGLVFPAAARGETPPAAHIQNAAQAAKNFKTISWREMTPSPTSPSVTDSCLPLLKSIRHTNPPSVTDRNQRTAGTAAALGLVMGLRYALTPPILQDQKPLALQRTGQTAVQTPAASSRALAIAAYRNCRKDHALRALDVPEHRYNAAVI